MFTKEHFEKVASTLSAAHASAVKTAAGTQYTVEHARGALDRLAEDFADIFAESNERFSRGAFIAACRAASRSEIRRLVTVNNKRLARTGCPTAQYKLGA